jgi:hypothetical protein
MTLCVLALEGIASAGARAAVADRAQYTVGTSSMTDFLEAPARRLSAGPLWTTDENQGGGRDCLTQFASVLWQAIGRGEVAEVSDRSPASSVRRASALIGVVGPGFRARVVAVAVVDVGVGA